MKTIEDIINEIELNNIDYDYLPTKYKHNQDIIKYYLTNKSSAKYQIYEELYHINKELLTKDFILDLLNIQGVKIGFMWEVLPDNIKMDLTFVKHILNEIKSNKDKRKCQNIIDYYIKDNSMLEYILKENESMFFFMPENMRGDKKIVEQVIEKNASMFRHVSSDIKKDKEFILKNLDKNIYEYIDESLKSDEEILYLAVNNNPMNFLNIVCNNKITLELFKMGIKKYENNRDNFSAFNHVLEFLKNDDIKNDIEVMEVYKRNNVSIEYWSKQNKNNKELVLERLETRKIEYCFISKELKQDEDILKLIYSNDIKNDINLNGLDKRVFYQSNDFFKNSKNIELMISLVDNCKDIENIDIKLVLLTNLLDNKYYEEEFEKLNVSIDLMKVVKEDPNIIEKLNGLVEKKLINEQIVPVTNKSKKLKY